MNKLDQLRKFWDAAHMKKVDSVEWFDWADESWRAWPDIERALRAADEYHRNQDPDNWVELAECLAPLLEDDDPS